VIISELDFRRARLSAAVANMLKEFFIIFCLWLCSKSIKSSSGHDIKIIAESLTEIVKKVYLSKGNLEITTAVDEKNSHELFDVLSECLRNFEDLTVTIEKIENVKPLRDRRRTSNIFIIDSVKSFKKICEKINYDNFKMRKLFTVVNLKVSTENEIQEIFDCFMSKLIVNVNVLNFSDLFTFFPFSNENSCKSTKPIKINEFDKKWKNSNFQFKKSKNMKNCPLKIGVAVLSTQPGIILTKFPNKTDEVSGVEKEIFDEFSKRLNFKADYKIFNTSVGKVFPNGTGTDTLGAAIDNKIDVAIGFISLQLIRTFFLSQTIHYDMHAMGLVGEF
jgi:hypothetical protein